MKVRTGAVTQNRSLDIELDTAVDFSPDHFAGKSTTQVFLLVSAEADKLLVTYLYNEGLISSDLAKTRINAINRTLKAANG